MNRLKQVLRGGAALVGFAWALLAAWHPGQAQAQAQAPTLRLAPGESQVLTLPQPAQRVAVGHPGVMDYVLLNARELLVVGKAPGATTLLWWNPQGVATTVATEVAIQLGPLQSLLSQVLPQERDIQLLTSGDAVVLSGTVSDPVAADTAQRLALSQWPQDRVLVPPAPGREAAPAAPPVKVLNLLKVRAPQQVMLEVRVAEMSKAYLESLGVEWSQLGGKLEGSLMGGFVSNATLNLILGRGVSQKVNPDGTPLFVPRQDSLKVDAQRKDGWVKILAEPTIVALSGQEGRFLVGGKIFIPVNQALGSTTYEERSFGVGLKFVPTVLQSGRIHLKVAPEISEPVKESVTAGTTASLPAFKSSMVSTTVEMAEGENLVIAGLLRDNVNEIVKAVPLLSQIPVLGSLFRNSQYITERTELLIVVKPTLVQAQKNAPALPTDRFVPPSRAGFFLHGQMQGQGADSDPVKAPEPAIPGSVPPPVPFLDLSPALDAVRRGTVTDTPITPPPTGNR